MTSNTIILKTFDYRADEGRAAGVVTPGQLVKRGTAGTFTRHATVGGEGTFYLAVESALNGKTIDDNYASGDLLFLFVPQKGDEVFIPIDIGETIVVGDLLQSAGNGNFEKRTSTNKVFAEAMEAVDLAQTGDVVTRIRAVVL